MSTLKERGWYHTPAHRRWRKLVMQKCNWLCQECLRQGRIKTATEAHHIKELEAYPELALDVNNGEGLCWDCHELTKTRIKKEVDVPDGVRVIKI